MSHFINRKEDFVQEALDGLVASSGGGLRRLDGYPFIRIVLRSDWDKSQVAVISGGGSGHEPAHAGFVGEGMLTAAVCGDVFASPSVEAVLAGILAVTGEAGCLLIVKNYTGDRLNFGLAAERARALGLKVAMVIVEDDIAIRDAPRPRGVAGTLIVHKIAGATASAGGTLEQVAGAAMRAAKGVKSIGISLDTCRVPGSPKENRILPGEIEVGLGIHGEAGAQRLSFEGAQASLKIAVQRLEPHFETGELIALVNNLGGTTALEMAVLTDELRRLPIGDRISHVIGPAAMMTALDMHGFSLTFFAPQAGDVDLILAPTPVKAWPGAMAFMAPGLVPLSGGLAPLKVAPSSHEGTRGILQRCCDVLIASEAELNLLDAKAGDGDTGSTVANAARALIGSLDRLPLADNVQLLRALGQELSQTVGGSSGVLLAIMFTAAGDGASGGLPLAEALKFGMKRMQEVGGARLGDRTMIDALAPALEHMESGMRSAAYASREGAKATAGMMRARAGRAAYVNSEQFLGFADAGAEAVARVFEALAAGH